MEQTLAIRPAAHADVAAIRRLVRAAYALYVPRIGREPAPMGADYEALVAAGEVHVAGYGDEVAGVLVVRPEGDGLLLENVAVAPERQGRGVGRALLAHAERLAAERGLADVHLYTNARMTENLGLYPALGYAETGRGREHGFDRVYFRKAIA